MKSEEIQLDPFQGKAIQELKQGHSVIVSAPTGAGKTLIAEEIIEKALGQGKGVIYTAPIKALSNQKFRDFSAQFPDRVGIITGDVKINPNAQVLIMTTEIFRNYLLQSPEKLRDKEWIIFDEIHYLDDIQRGTVWEESILFLPPEMKILALSATLPNIEELRSWIQKIHRHQIKKVEERKRPVPLHFYYQLEDRIFPDFKKLQRYLSRTKSGPSKASSLQNLISYLQKNNFLPCIYFSFSRKRCEMLARALLKENFLNGEESRQATQIYYNYCRKFKILGQDSASLLFPLIQRGIAYHHAGLLPPLKEIIEQLFSRKLIQVIFTTETFALGINMPSRSVCFDGIVKYYRNKIRYLRIRDFYQMAGRAGRRGIDEEGYIFVRLRPYKQEIKALRQILSQKIEPIRSQFNASYATILNLYKELKENLLKIYPKSFHYYQFKKDKSREMQLLKSKLSLLKQLGYIKEGTLTQKGHFSSNLFGYELILGELWSKTYLEEISWEELGVIVSAIVTELRAKSPIPKLNRRLRKLKRKIEEEALRIQKIEKHFHIFPQIKKTNFQLANAISAWLKGESFSKIVKLTSVDEGEIIRNFRMCIQVLRDMNQKVISPQLRQKINKVLYLLNRDIVDAEWQLKISPL